MRNRAYRTGEGEGEGGDEVRSKRDPDGRYTTLVWEHLSLFLEITRPSHHRLGKRGRAREKRVGGTRGTGRQRKSQRPRHHGLVKSFSSHGMPARET